MSLDDSDTRRILLSKRCSVHVSQQTGILETIIYSDAAYVRELAFAHVGLMLPVHE